MRGMMYAWGVDCIYGEMSKPGEETHCGLIQSTAHEDTGEK